MPYNRVGMCVVFPRVPTCRSSLLPAEVNRPVCPVGARSHIFAINVVKIGVKEHTKHTLRGQVQREPWPGFRTAFRTAATAVSVAFVCVCVCACRKRVPENLAAVRSFEPIGSDATHQQKKRALKVEWKDIIYGGQQSGCRCGAK